MKKILICAVAALLVGCAPPALKTRPNQKVATINYGTGIDAQLESLARQVAIQLGRKRCGRIGIQGFYDVNGRSKRFEKYVETEFTNRLLRITRLRIYTVRDLIQDDISAPLSSSMDTNNARTKPKDTEHLQSYLVGSTIEFPQGVKISVQIMEARTGYVFGTAAVVVQKDKMVQSLLDHFGEKRYSSFGNPDYRVGEVIKTGENQYINLIPHEYILYVKQINFQYALFSDSFSNVEIFINEDFRVMNVDDMISIIYDKERYILSLRDVSNGAAVFTFAHLNDGKFKATENFSWLDKEPYLSQNESDSKIEDNSSTSSNEEDSEEDASSSDDSTAVEKTDNADGDDTKSETENTSEEADDSAD